MTGSHSTTLGTISSVLAASCSALVGISFALNAKSVWFLCGIFLSVFVLLNITSVKAFISEPKRVYIDCAAAFGVIYGILVGIVYYTQISTVLRGTLSQEQLEIVALAPGTVFFFVSMFGYFFLCLATLFMALAVDRRFKAYRIVLWINGAMAIPTFLIPFLPVSYTTEAPGQFGRTFVVNTVVWCIIFAAACLLSTDYFRKQRSNSTSPLKSSAK